eukprot:201847-Amphidinium_carterae.1
MATTKLSDAIPAQTGHSRPLLVELAWHGASELAVHFRKKFGAQEATIQEGEIVEEAFEDVSWKTWKCLFQDPSCPKHVAARCGLVSASRM